ncbi:MULTISPECIES: HAD-IIA family hydrolase [Ferrimicrobium]|jgi:4-nitrophenyl phosphatase|uniref:HAD-IIA family hydrolase n=1 Tax=Ferrimicrobium acidiphilum TaxID=121039 RepID=A0ABV3Y1B0_9ACTN|nr:HAD-IIA family hydrolase [Ferrimicrobium sp.]
MQWLLDLDGVVWRMDTPIDGSVEAVNRLLAQGHDVRFVTNNSSLSRSQYVAKLGRMGVEAQRDQILTSAMAAATLVKPGDRVLAIGELGLVEELEAVGADLVVPRSLEDVVGIDSVVLGWYRKFSYIDMSNACVAILSGARFVATNADPTYPLERLVVPGTGALVASVVTATSVSPTVAGKPEDPMVGLLRPLLEEHTIMVGDRLSTDGRFAARLGVEFGLVSSGIQEAHDHEIPVSLAAHSLAEIVNMRLV